MNEVIINQEFTLNSNNPFVTLSARIRVATGRELDPDVYSNQNLSKLTAEVMRELGPIFDRKVEEIFKRK